jgi:hypothetical protein
MRLLPVRFVWSQWRWRGRSRRSAGNLPALAEPGRVPGLRCGEATARFAPAMPDAAAG